MDKMKEKWWFIVFLMCLSPHSTKCQRITKQDIYDEDDDVIAEAIPTISLLPLQKRQYISTTNDNQQQQQQNVGNLVENIASAEPAARRSPNVDAASVVGDVNKYGLWEYTSDNTGMGDQIKSLMNKANSIDVANELSSHALESQGRKMNEKIDKYAEDTSESAPNVDPMESPPSPAEITDHVPSQQKVASFYNNNKQHRQPTAAADGEKLYNGGEHFNYVTIPSTMTIEDEHGQHLDTVNADSTRAMVKEDFDQKPLSAAPLRSSAIKKKQGVLSAILEAAKLHPTHSLLTARLLKAMQKSTAFRKHAEDLVPTEKDTEIELFQKERQLAKFLKEYENSGAAAVENGLQSSVQPELKLTIPSLLKDDVSVEKEKASQGRGKILNVIKKLIHDDYTSHDEEGKVLHELMSTLRSSEKEESKVEADFQDSGGGTGGDGESLSEPYLNHFKEFLQKQKQANIHEETSPDDEEHPLGSEGSPLKGYLEQEASSVNRFHESGANPKIDLQKLETLLAQQEAKHVSVEEQNEKLLNEQLQRLMHDKSDSEEKIKQIKEHSGESKDTLTKDADKNDESSSSSSESSEEFDNAILNYIKHSKRFKKLLKQHEILTNDEKEDVKEDSEQKDNGEDGKSSNQEDSEPLSVQLKEIELQKEILNLQEKKLKNRDKEKDDVKKKIKKLKAEAEKVDHLFHLAKPVKEEEDGNTTGEKGKGEEKTSDTKDKNDDSKKGKKLKQEASETEGKESASTVGKNKSNKSSSESLSSAKPTEKKDENESSNKSSKNQETSEKKSPEPPSSKENLDGNNHHDTTSTKTESPKLNMAVVSPVQHFIHAEPPKLNTVVSSSNPHSKKFFSNVIKEDAEVKLGLPINNPKPEAEETLQPNAFYRYTGPPRMAHYSSDYGDSEGSRNVLTPMHSSKKHNAAPSLMNITSPLESSKATASHHTSPPSLINITSSFSSGETRSSSTGSSPHSSAPSLMNLSTGSTKESTTTPTTDKKMTNKATNGHDATTEHHDFPIIEPPPLTSDKLSSNFFLPERKSYSPLPSSPTRTGSSGLAIISNLLKHRTIPTAPDELGGSIPSIRFIKPRSHSVDVSASKKGFGKLPLKPKEYLIQELKADLKLLTSKRHFINTTASQILSRGNKTLNRNPTTFELKTISNTTVYQEPKHNVLVPYRRNATFIAASKQNKEQPTFEKHVLVPPTSSSTNRTSKYSTANTVLKSRSTVELSSRNQVSKNLKNEEPTNIEDVFNILRSEDQAS